jgi:hypothetical protein
VLDYRMPRLDGIGVAKRVLEANKWLDMWRVFAEDIDGNVVVIDLSHMPDNNNC